MSDITFKPNIKGFDEMRNMPGVQRECLRVAKDIAGQAGAACGGRIFCDVQPGKKRAHARASVKVQSGKDAARNGVRGSVEAGALRAAAVAHGGTGKGHGE